jgi:hypothetical protein
MYGSTHRLVYILLSHGRRLIDASREGSVESLKTSLRPFDTDGDFPATHAAALIEVKPSGEFRTFRELFERARIWYGRAWGYVIEGGIADWGTPEFAELARIVGEIEDAAKAVLEFADTGLPAEQPAADVPKLEPEAHAIALLVEEPDLKQQEVAERVGRSRQQLYKYQRYQKARRLQKAPAVPRGSVEEDGTIEAIDED